MDKKRILHIASDDKYMNTAIKQFNEIDFVDNEFAIIKMKKEKKCLTFISKFDNVIIVNLFSSKYNKLIEEIPSYDVIIFHSVNKEKILLLKHIPAGITIVWMFIGWDGYQFIDKELISFQTKKILIENSLKNRIQKMIPLVIKTLLKKNKLKHIKSLIMRSDYCASVIREDYELLKEFLALKAKFVDFHYGGVKIHDIENSKKKRNIIIGNSANPTNNHIDIFDKIHNSKLKFNRVIVPISYGNMKYKKIIKQYGEKIFADKVLFLEKFLPLREYEMLISECRVGIMNHYRQQAMGNILILLASGCKVYLNTENPVYSYLTRIGVKVFSIDDLCENTIKDIFVQLPLKLRQKNRDIIMKEYGYRNAIELTKKLVTLVLK